MDGNMNESYTCLYVTMSRGLARRRQTCGLSRIFEKSYSENITKQPRRQLELSKLGGFHSDSV
jgi:hypothetical protein